MLACACGCRTLVFKILIASLSIASAFKVNKPAVPLPKDKALGLQLRGGGPDPATLAKYAVYFCSGFMFIPAGRDIVAPGTAIMPDDDKLLGAMFDDKSKPGWTFMWNAWGLNWIMLSIMKIMAVTSGNADFIKLGFAADAAGVLLMLKGWLPEFAPFLAMFGIETLALAKLAFA